MKRNYRYAKNGSYILLSLWRKKKSRFLTILKSYVILKHFRRFGEMFDAKIYLLSLVTGNCTKKVLYNAVISEHRDTIEWFAYLSS